jgi:hypothetical protein
MLSQFEALPTEILTKIFLLEPNFSLPRASLHLGFTLATNLVFNRLALLAFSRDDEVSWPDAYYLNALEACTYCELAWVKKGSAIRKIKPSISTWEKIDARAVKKLFHTYGDVEIEDWYLDEYQRAGCEEEYDDTDEEGSSVDEEVEVSMKEAKETQAECVQRRNKRRVIWRLKMCEEMGRKRYLQQEVMRSKWFKLKHVQKVESCCKKCPTENTVTFGLDVCSQLGFFPCKIETMFAYFRTFHHRRHVLHGIDLPKRLLTCSFQGREDDKELLTKLMGWTDEGNWATDACSFVRSTALAAADEGMKDAIRKGRLADVEFFGDRVQPYPCIGVETSMLMIKIALVENRQTAKNDQILLYLLEQFECRKLTKWWKDPAWLPCFNAAKKMRTAEKTKERGKWLVFHLKEQRVPRTDDEAGSSYVYRIREQQGTLDPNMPLKRMSEVVDNELGVEQIWGWLTRRERRRFEGCRRIDDSVMLNMMRVSHMLAGNPSESTGNAPRWMAGKLWGLSRGKLEEMGAVIPES